MTFSSILKPQFPELSNFYHKSNDFTVFEARTNNFFDSNQITNGNVKRACSLNALSEETYLLLRKLCIPIPDTLEVK